MEIDKDLTIGMISCNKCHRELSRDSNKLKCNECNQVWIIKKFESQ